MPSLAALGLRLLSHPALSRACGWAAERRVPAPLLRGVISAYVRHYGVDLGEAAPGARYRSFDEFFTRRLRPDARPVDPRPGVVVSPCDAKVYAWGRVPADGRIEQIKGKTYALGDLLGDAELAAAFRGGAQATLYLSPAMYHRVHWPVDGRVRGSWRIPGRLYPVNALAIHRVDGLFAVNRRVVIDLEAEATGRLAVVMVGATNVGRIELVFEGEPPVRRGAELGAFHLGSTVVVLAADPRLVWTGPPAGQLVKMGEALWQRP
jgi:phosphatidylserine decarboxylase